MGRDLHWLQLLCGEHRLLEHRLVLALVLVHRMMQAGGGRRQHQGGEEEGKGGHVEGGRF